MRTTKLALLPPFCGLEDDALLLSAPPDGSMSSGVDVSWQNRALATHGVVVAALAQADREDPCAFFGLQVSAATVSHGACTDESAPRIGEVGLPWRWEMRFPARVAGTQAPPHFQEVMEDHFCSLGLQQQQVTLMLERLVQRSVPHAPSNSTRRLRAALWQLAALVVPRLGPPSCWHVPLARCPSESWASSSRPTAVACGGFSLGGTPKLPCEGCPSHCGLDEAYLLQLLVLFSWAACAMKFAETRFVRRLECQSCEKGSK